MKKSYIVISIVFFSTSILSDEIKITDVESQYAIIKNVKADRDIKQSINLGFANTTGDSKTSNMNGKYAISFITPGYNNNDLKVAFNTTAYVSKSNGIKDNEEYTADLDLEESLTHNWLGYASISWLKNKFRNLNNRYNFGIGFGKYLMKNNMQSLKVKLGIARNIEDYTNNQSKSKFTSANQYLEYNRKFNSVSSLYIKFGIREDVENFDDYQSTTVGGFSFNIAEKLSLDVEEEVSYDSTPPVGFKKTNTKSIIRLGYNF